MGDREAIRKTTQSNPARRLEIDASKSFANAAQSTTTPPPCAGGGRVKMRQVVSDQVSSLPPRDSPIYVKEVNNAIDSSTSLAQNDPTLAHAAAHQIAAKLIPLLPPEQRSSATEKLAKSGLVRPEDLAALNRTLVDAYHSHDLPDLPPLFSPSDLPTSTPLLIDRASNNQNSNTADVSASSNASVPVVSGSSDVSSVSQSKGSEPMTNSDMSTNKQNELTTPRDSPNEVATNNSMKNEREARDMFSRFFSDLSKTITGGFDLLLGIVGIRTQQQKEPDSALDGVVMDSSSSDQRPSNPSDFVTAPGSALSAFSPKIDNLGSESLVSQSLTPIVSSTDRTNIIGTSETTVVAKAPSALASTPVAKVAIEKTDRVGEFETTSRTVGFAFGSEPSEQTVVGGRKLLFMSVTSAPARSSPSIVSIDDDSSSGPPPPQSASVLRSIKVKPSTRKIPTSDSQVSSKKTKAPFRISSSRSPVLIPAASTPAQKPKRSPVKSASRISPPSPSLTNSRSARSTPRQVLLPKPVLNPTTPNVVMPWMKTNGAAVSKVHLRPVSQVPLVVTEEEQALLRNLRTTRKIRKRVIKKDEALLAKEVEKRKASQKQQREKQKKALMDRLGKIIDKRKKRSKKNLK
ncbi:hypothetical protein HY990_06105 [Candidatus Micrarchaeota archaeon]|nr:hypothetical protein [Candidatus Micrarchaeota archaeon]